MQHMTIFKKHAVISSEAVAGEQSVRYARFSFVVEKRCVKLRLIFHQTSTKEAQLPLCLFDSEGRIRIMHAPEGSRGSASHVYELSEDMASRGGIPGPLPEGEWKFIVYKRRFLESIPITITVDAVQLSDEEIAQEANPGIHRAEAKPFSSKSIEASPNGAWYNGELHVHSEESTGRTSVAEIIAVAKAQNIDFLAITDHFTASHWLRIQAVDNEGPPLLLQSMEVSGDKGHANIHGIQTWINPLVDDNKELSDFLGLDQSPSMELIADQTHEQGGLFSINHALSGGVAWRYSDFPMEKADLFEIWCTPDSTTTFLYPTMWDMLLCQGYRLIGVGSSDSHHPTIDGPWQLGKIRTWVFAKDLSQRGILDGLREGKVFISHGEASLDFNLITEDGVVHGMGEAVNIDDDEWIDVSVSLYNHTSGNLFIMVSGLLFDVRYFESGERDLYSLHIKVVDLPKTKTGLRFIRLEFHEDIEKAKFWGMAWRDSTSMRLLSNPIWITTRKG